MKQRTFLGLALLLAACQSGDDSNQTSMDSDARARAPLQPGLWELKLEKLKEEPAAPPGRSDLGKPITKTECVVPEEAGNIDGYFFFIPTVGGDCTREFTSRNGKVSGTKTCTFETPVKGKTNQSFQGDYTRRSYTIVRTYQDWIDVEDPNRPGAQTTALLSGGENRVTARWIAATCPKEEPEEVTGLPPELENVVLGDEPPAAPGGIDNQAGQ